MKFNIDQDDFVLPKKAEQPAKESTTQKVPANVSPQPIVEDKTIEDIDSSSKAVPSPANDKKTQKHSNVVGEKHAGGRPKKDITRKQYTLTLREEDYKRAMQKAAEEDISFAKLVEKALKAYI